MGAEAVKSYRDLVRHICDHRRMYTEDGRFMSVVAWINGYYFGLCVNGNQPNESFDIGGFRDWLSERCNRLHGMEQNLTWDIYIENLYESEEDALKELPDLFDEYNSQRQFKYH